MNVWRRFNFFRRTAGTVCTIGLRRHGGGSFRAAARHVLMDPVRSGAGLAEVVEAAEDGSGRCGCGEPKRSGGQSARKNFSSLKQVWADAQIGEARDTAEGEIKCTVTEIPFAG